MVETEKKTCICWEKGGHLNF